MACINDTFLIIGGSTKSGTTSLFHYLAYHPQICPSLTKEPRFFLDRTYPLPAKFRIDDGIDKYFSYFEKIDAPVYLESSPDYLYSINAASLISDNLKNAHVVFILRDPIDRLLSWYGFAKQTNRLKENVGLEDFVADQLALGINEDCPQHMRSLEQGKYSNYLKLYMDALGAERVHVVWFEELKHDPRKIVEEICSFLGLSSDCYNSYQFKVENQTVEMRSAAIHRAYMDFSRYLRGALHHNPNVRRYLKMIKKRLDIIYQSLNSKGAQKKQLSEMMEAKLIEYYRLDVMNLELLLGKKIPWHRFE